jgi:VWFA-related protein
MAGNRSSLVAAALALSALAGASAQQPAPPPPSAPPAATPPRQAGAPVSPQDPQAPPRFRGEANFVRVDVYPTADGKPVQDLGAGDFEVLENGAPQQVQAFEHVVISPAGPQSSRIEPGSVQGGEQMAANPRNRVFVIFLDIAHVAVEGSHHIKEPLIRLLDRVLGPDDLVAVMTPDMSAKQITFGRKTEIIADMLRDRWSWGMRHSLAPVEQRELEYEGCYPLQAQKGVVQQMVNRRRERAALSALQDLVTYLGGVREERKAILAVTEGWVLYRPDRSLTELRGTEPVPGKDPVGIDEHGKLRVGATQSRDANPASATTCDRERMYLASIDNEDYFRQMMDSANRSNASFYPVDPRGLAVFDSPIGPLPPPPIDVDMRAVKDKVETLRTLAENTDGMAVVNSNNLDAGLRRIADDLTSYYLLGYYSSNTKLDGGYRKITVRVKRPGVSVRARRGYRAPTMEEVNASRSAAAAPVPERAQATSAALATLGRIRADNRFSIRAVPVRAAAGSPITALWIAGELIGPAQQFAAGGSAAIELSGGSASTATAALEPGQRGFLVKVPLQSADGAIDVRARLSSAKGEPLADSTRLDPSDRQPLLFRRGLSTGNRVQPAADFRFSRTERLRLELPLAGAAAPGRGRMLDRNGQPLQVPVTLSERTDADGQRWLVGEATLSALGAGDYIVEVEYKAGAKTEQVLTAIRVTR